MIYKIKYDGHHNAWLASGGNLVDSIMDTVCIEVVSFNGIVSANSCEPIHI